MKCFDPESFHLVSKLAVEKLKVPDRRPEPPLESFLEVAARWPRSDVKRITYIEGIAIPPTEGGKLYHMQAMTRLGTTPWAPAWEIMVPYLLEETEFIRNYGRKNMNEFDDYLRLHGGPPLHLLKVPGGKKRSLLIGVWQVEDGSGQPSMTPRLTPGADMRP